MHQSFHPIQPAQHPNGHLHPRIETWLAHIRMLAEEIGPRGSTTPAERKGAEYCLKVLQDLGLEPSMDAFKSARSIYQPHLLASVVLLLAFILYPLAGRLTATVAAVISLVALTSELLELGFRDNLWRKLVAKGDSQNVVASLPPAGEHLQDLILIGHIDSHRTPLIFRSSNWVAAYKIFTTLAFAAFFGQVILYFLGALMQWPWIWPLTILSAVSAILLAALCLEADRTPFSAGANDNASAVGMVLTLAEHFLTEPLKNTRLWLVCTGCEEVQHYGAIDFFRRYRSQFKNPRAIAFEMLGCAGPAWLEKEGIIVPFNSDPDMVRMAQDLAYQYPEWGAYPTQINGGNTEMADALRNGIPAITLMGLTRQGDGPYWHMLSDTVDKMNPSVLSKVFPFTLEMIRRLDEKKWVDPGKA